MKATHNGQFSMGPERFSLCQWAPDAFSRNLESASCSLKYVTAVSTASPDFTVASRTTARASFDSDEAIFRQASRSGGSPCRPSSPLQHPLAHDDALLHFGTLSTRTEARSPDTVAISSAALSFSILPSFGMSPSLSSVFEGLKLGTAMWTTRARFARALLACGLALREASSTVLQGG